VVAFNSVTFIPNFAEFGGLVQQLTAKTNTLDLVIIVEKRKGK
jgi:hypothetical protein